MKTTDVFTRNVILYDLLSYETNNKKTFTFNSADDVYDIQKNYGDQMTTLAQTGDLEIKGVYDSINEKVPKINLYNSGTKYIYITMNPNTNLKVSNVLISRPTNSTVYTFNLNNATGTFENVHTYTVGNFLKLLGSSVVDRITVTIDQQNVKENPFIYNTSNSIIKDVTIMANLLTSRAGYGSIILNSGFIGYEDTSFSLGDENRYKGGIHSTVFNRIWTYYGNGMIYNNGGKIYNISDSSFLLYRNLWELRGINRDKKR